MRIQSVILFILAALVIIPIQAQVLINKGQLIHISTNTLVTVEGNAKNEGIIINNGSLAVSGDWDNRLSYNAGTGTFILNGKNRQLIKHNNQDFYKLQLSGTGEKVLESNANITQELILNTGLLTPALETILLVKEKAKITGGSIDSYINGRLCHEGTGYKFFPIGKNAHYTPVILEAYKGISPITGFEVFEPNTGASPREDLQIVSQVRYWQQTQLSGTTSDAFITLSFDKAENIKNIDSLVVAETSQMGNLYHSLGKESVSGTSVQGRITSKRPITGNIFAIGIASSEVPAGLLYVPNAFSPLAALDEDRTVKVYGSNISTQDLQFSIYNRWGNLVYESETLAEITTTGWNGFNLHTGLSESSGVYTYTLQGKFINGKPFKKVGTITLIK